jgi:hypothetical protein
MHEDEYFIAIDEAKQHAGTWDWTLELSLGLGALFLPWNRSINY